MHFLFSFQFHVSTTCHSDAIAETIEVLFEHFVPEMIVLPSLEEAREEINLFHQRSNFHPDVWACIDGTHIKVKISST